MEVLANLPGDSTLYGLTCECNDSIIQVLPNDLSDPLTFDITPAWKNHKIFGMPQVGDNVAIILSKDSLSAEMIINVDKLTGKWWYMVEPRMRKPAAMDDKQFEKMSREMEKNMTDSLRAIYFKPLEYGLEINSNKSITIIREKQPENTEGGFSLIEYPEPLKYKEWNLFNGKLMLTGYGKKPVTDTLTFDILHNDSLIIHTADGDMNFYRKTEQ